MEDSSLQINEAKVKNIEIINSDPASAKVELKMEKGQVITSTLLPVIDQQSQNFCNIDKGSNEKLFQLKDNENLNTSKPIFSHIEEQIQFGKSSSPVKDPKDLKCILAKPVEKDKNRIFNQEEYKIDTLVSRLGS